MNRVRFRWLDYDGETRKRVIGLNKGISDAIESAVYEKEISEEDLDAIDVYYESATPCQIRKMVEVELEEMK
jgi:hypothetical protein